MGRGLGQRLHALVARLRVPRDQAIGTAANGARPGPTPSRPRRSSLVSRVRGLRERSSDSRFCRLATSKSGSQASPISYINESLVNARSVRWLSRCAISLAVSSSNSISAQIKQTVLFRDRGDSLVDLSHYVINCHLNPAMHQTVPPEYVSG